MMDTIQKKKKKRKKNDVSFLNWQRKIGSRSREGKRNPEENSPPIK